MKVDRADRALLFGRAALALSVVAVVLSLIALLRKPEPRGSDEDAVRAEAARNGIRSVSLPLRPQPMDERIRHLQPPDPEDAGPRDGG